MTGLSFAHVNLRHNPFGSLDRETWVACAVVDVEALLAAVRPGVVVQLLGDHGRDKTTHLLALEARLAGATYVRPLTDRDAAWPACAVLLLDEADSLWPWRRFQAFRHAPAVVAATHRDLSPEIRVAGRRPHVVRIGGVNEPRLLVALERRIERARRGQGPVPRVGPEAVRTLVQRHGDDWRAIEDVLYDRFSRLERVGDVEV